MTEDQKRWIDGATYGQLLRRWRFAPVGDPFFQGDTGDYYAEALRRKKEEVGDDAAVSASKSIGWDK